MNVDFEQKIALLQQQHEALLQRSNLPVEETNGIVCRYTYPIVTREHIPLEWRYDFNPATNPYCMERIGFNATMNSGAIKWNGKYVLVVRVEGADRKSFFAVAESPNGIDNFRFWKRPITLRQCTGRRPFVSSGKGRYCPYQGFGGMGTFAGPEVLQSAAERSASS